MGIVYGSRPANFWAPGCALPPRAIPLREPDEEPLVRREAVNGLEILVFRGVFPSDVPQNLAAEVGYVFAESELAVDLDIIYDDVLRILIANTFGALIEFLAILFRPPVLQVSLRIVLAAFVVETVREFVADRAASVAVIRRGVHFGIVERWLKNAGREIDVVHLR